MKIYALIPARQGSKGLPNKAFYPLNNKPLVAYTIESALRTEYISEVWVSSDSAQVRQISEAYNINFLNRPKHLASDEATSEQVITHFIESLDLSGDALLLLLQPTSPLRTNLHIDEALMLLKNTSSTRGVISVSEPTVKPLKAFSVGEDGYLHGLINDQYPFANRQKLPSAYYSNGAIYAFYIRDFMLNRTIPMLNIKPYIMDAISSIDIDNQEDILLAESAIKGLSNARI